MNLKTLFLRFALTPALLALTSMVHGQSSVKETNLHSFRAKSSVSPYPNVGGDQPNPSLIQTLDGNFYGTTLAGGANGTGTVFKLTPTRTLTTLHTFAALTGDQMNVGGAYPYAGLILGTDGNLYGTTSVGGLHAAGTVFRISTAGVFETLYNFSGVDGDMPYAGLIQGTDGNFYGTTTEGGTNGQGTVFALTPAGALTILHDFSAITNHTNSDGALPYGKLVQGRDGNFYGTTQYAGTKGNGTIFKITTSQVLTVLHAFDGSDGGTPIAGLVEGIDGNFYGTTEIGGLNGYGTVFMITPTGQMTSLHSFDTDDGAEPIAGLIQAKVGNFYGTTVGYRPDGGTVFVMTPGGTLTTLHAFSGDDGSEPWAGVIQGIDGDFYGTTQFGGANGTGAIFELAITPMILHGIDVSDDQEAIDWSEVAKSDNTFAFVKATSGLLGKQATFEQNMQNARAAGLKVGAYHFSYPYKTPSNTGEAEAQHFISVAGNYLTSDEHRRGRSSALYLGCWQLSHLRLPAARPGC